MLSRNKMANFSSLEETKESFSSLHKQPNNGGKEILNKKEDNSIVQLSITLNNNSNSYYGFNGVKDQSSTMNFN